MRNLTGAASAAEVARALREGETGLLVPASWVPAEVPEGRAVTAACGFPTGRHHPLIKASEARLAVQSGATGVLIVLDASADEHAWMVDLITAREAVSDQVLLAAGVDARSPRRAEMEAVARRAGAAEIVPIECSYGVCTSET
ncbi:deoxyribose-phosphate aldolase [Corynebacterium mastitidis]|uniref:Deoxyribose-phosphate aldolase n=1 Tax=Corynebacterium mastitidis TaxID=161890 RepID=A0A2N0X888_9CORY|nr:deoxyribose-phosphate aldolase [Corynebacterium mastitidis]MCH6197103.1 deoxyribose-phosphate aldolase [Corynebacterium mastitidis]PKF68887.1 deoxyribose-phosphate aldolase [Corynebacterium mastitidis]